MPLDMPGLAAALRERLGQAPDAPGADITPRLVALLHLWRDPDGVGYATLPGGRHVPTAGSAFAGWVGHQAFTLARQTKRDKLGDAVAALDARARYAETVHRVYRRTGWGADGSLWLNLSREDCKVVRVDADGWEVRDPCPEAPRMLHSGEMPLPVQTDRPLDALLPAHFNLGDDPDEGARALCAFAVAALRPEPARYHLAVGGEQGAVKTMTARLVKRLVDPSRREAMAPPKSVHDLAVAGKHEQLVSLDNLSSLNAEFSDLLAQAATGSVMSNRGLYTDSDVADIPVAFAAILNGIGDLLWRPDLAERTLLVKLSRPTRRRLEDEVYRTFAAAQPELLGALLNGLAGSLRHADAVKAATPPESLPRMADAYCWAAGAGMAWGWEDGAWLEDVRRQGLAASLVAVEGSATMTALVELLRLRPEPEFTGTAGEVLDLLESSPGRWHRDEHTPRTPRAMRSALDRFAPALRALGWGVSHRAVGKGADSRTVWTIARPPEVAP